MSDSPVIAIAGGGFSGTLVAVQLAHQSAGPLHLLLCDQSGMFARGVAYGTREPAHLLNVSAARMGAFPDRPDDFHLWLLSHESVWRPRYPSLIVTPASFLPRMLYGDYLAWLLAQAEQEGKVRIERVAAQVTGAVLQEDEATLTFSAGAPRKVRRLVLAPGNPPARPFAPDGPRSAGHLWRPPEGSILTRRDFREEDAPVVIIGTGLTTIDAILSLRKAGYGGRIIAVSRHGLLPQPHATGLEPYPAFLPPAFAPKTALGLVRAIRREVRRARARGIDWRAVVDALRADTPALWGGLPESEREKLLPLLAFWNVHRHRMPPESARMLEREIRAGGLDILAGHVRRVSEEPQGFRIELQTRRGTLTLRAAHLINCSGPDASVTRWRNPLIAVLLASGVLRPGPLGQGIALPGGYRVANTVFALGPLLLGERLETVAVPELRAQAAELAQALLASLA